MDLYSRSSITLDDGTVLTRCDQCRAMWKERNERGIEGDPPCSTCKVELMEGNEEVADIYLLCRGQVIFFHNGSHDVPVDIDLKAVFQAIDRYSGMIRDKWGTAKRVRKLFFQMKEKDED